MDRRGGLADSESKGSDDWGAPGDQDDDRGARRDQDDDRGARSDDRSAPGSQDDDRSAPGSQDDDRPVSALWREFTENPYGHPQIPYVGRAGRHAGADAEAPARHDAPRGPVLDAVARGADPTGARDAAPVLNRALAELGTSGGGTLLLPEGTYRVDDVIRIGHSGVTLRGAGSGRTRLCPTRSLTGIIGPYGPRDGGDKSGWSWAGGLVWLCPHERYEALTAAIRDRDWPYEGWSGNRRREAPPLTGVHAARRGARTVTVADASGLRPGRLVLLRVADDARHGLLAHIAGDGEAARARDWAADTKLLSYLPFEWPTRITRVDGDRVTLERPLPVDLRPEWHPELTSHITELTDSGVEGLTVGFPADTPASPHLHDRGFNGVVLQCAYDCWVEDVVVRDADNGFGLVAASACTLRRTRVAGRGAHHPYFCREASHDNLVEDFTIEARTRPVAEGTQSHGINVEGLSSHNVWSRGRMAMGTFDTHRGLPFANVRTEITVHNDGRHGGDLSAGPLYGARFAHWNITVTNGRAGLVRLDGVAPYSATVGISEVREFDQRDAPDFPGPLHSRLEAYGDPGAARPRNLHAAQRALRRAPREE